MNKIIIAAGLLALSTPAIADQYYIVQNPKSRVCTITQERPAGGGGGLVIGSPFGARAEAETHMKTVKECTETSGQGPAIQERREERVR